VTDPGKRHQVTILGFGGTCGPAAVWLAGPGQIGTLVVDQVDTARYALAFAHLTRHALSPAETAGLLGELAGDWPEVTSIQSPAGCDARGRLGATTVRSE
jgi:hypothetical protein